MLREILAKKRYVFAKSFDSWQEAIIASYQPLLDQGLVNTDYIQAAIDNVTEYGPYIVLIPGLAMPHSTDDMEGSFETAISFMHVEKEVDFDSNDPDKKAKLFFSMSAADPYAHVVNVSNLMKILENRAILQALLKCRDEKCLQEIADLVEEDRFHQ